MRTGSDNLLRVESEAPWRLTLTVARVGRDLVCHLHGGSVHVGAVALAEPGADGVRVRTLVATGHREGEVSAYAAHRVAETSGRRVACVAGIHFDEIDRRQIEEIVAAARALADEAAERIGRPDPESANGGA